MLYAQIILFPFLAWGWWRAGRRAAGGRGWWVVVAAGLGIIGLVILGHRVPRLSVVPPISWAIDPALNPPLMTAAIAAVFGVLLPKLPPGRTAPAARIAFAAMVIYYGLLPASLALATGPWVAKLRTHLDSNAVCRQTTPFTCGPAAAVTCLKRLGMDSQESELAVRARSTPSFGTDASLLAHTVNEQFPAVRCTYGYFDSLESLPLPAVASCILPRIGGHYVALLEVGGEFVVVGDPLSGRQKLPREQFLQEWTGIAIAFQRR